jgi:hypothetical protein
MNPEEPDRREVLVRVHFAAGDPPHGSVEIEGARYPFRGWVELIALLDGLRGQG